IATLRPVFASSPSPHYNVTARPSILQQLCSSQSTRGHRSLQEQLRICTLSTET
ncbi:hypothetical protein V5799_005059, partial [Amblyomma americanum]